jgi:flagellar protein FlgJ
MISPLDPQIMLSQLTSVKITEQQEGKESPEELLKLCQEFEAILYHSMFKGMRASVPEGGLIEQGIDFEIFHDLMDQEVARQAARKQSLALGKNLFKQLSDNETES